MATEQSPQMGWFSKEIPRQKCLEFFLDFWERFIIYLLVILDVLGGNLLPFMGELMFSADSHRKVVCFAVIFWAPTDWAVSPGFEPKMEHFMRNIIWCLVGKYIAGNSAGDLFWMVKWPFKRLSNLQLGNQKVTLNHVVQFDSWWCWCIDGF